MRDVMNIYRLSVWRIASGLLVIFPTASNAIAEERGGMCYSYAIETKDFRNIPAAMSVCNDIGLRCLSIDPSKVAELSSPIPYIDYDRQNTQLPTPPLPKSARCMGPVLAYLEIKPEEAIDYDKLTKDQEERLARLLPHSVNDIEWDDRRTSQHMTFQSQTDSDLSAEGLCYTDGTRYNHGTVHDCAIYQFRKSGRVFAINVVGSRWDPGMCGFIGGEDLHWLSGFEKKAAGQTFELLANSDFNRNISVTSFGIRASGSSVGHAPLEHQRATLELVIRNAHPGAKNGALIWDRPSRSFAIHADVKAEYCRQTESGSWLWIRSSSDVKAEWQKKARDLIRKIETSLCRVYRFGSLKSETIDELSIFDRGDVNYHAVMNYHFECTKGPASSSAAP